MGNKELTIINGVDVSGCEFAEETSTTPKCRINGWIHCDGQNCNYKQLQRKEQECEKEKQNAQDTYEMFQALMESFNITRKELQHKTVECEKLKEKRTDALKQLENFMNGDYCNNACLKVKTLKTERNKYKQALEEIEKDLKEDIYCENQECGCDNFEECLKCTKEHIIDIITNAKDGE